MYQYSVRTQARHAVSGLGLVLFLLHGAGSITLATYGTAQYRQIRRCQYEQSRPSTHFTHPNNNRLLVTNYIVRTPLLTFPPK